MVGEIWKENFHFNLEKRKFNKNVGFNAKDMERKLHSIIENLMLKFKKQKIKELIGL